MKFLFQISNAGSNEEDCCPKIEPDDSEYMNYAGVQQDGPLKSNVDDVTYKNRTNHVS